MNAIQIGDGATDAQHDQTAEKQQPIKAVQIGNRVIDTQHDQIFEWLSKLEQAYDQGQGYALIGGTLQNLQDYVDEHFETEERLMRRVGYPYIDQHRQQHQKLSDEVRKLTSEFQDDKPVLSIEVVQLLRTSLVDHINQVDAELGQYITGIHENGPVDPWRGHAISLQV